MERVTEILQDNKISDFSKVNPLVLSQAQEFGKNVHLACKLYDEHNLNMLTLDPELLPYLEGWMMFLADYRIKEFLNIEVTLYSKLGFQGTPDRIYKVNIRYIDIYDIKTAEEKYPASKIQLAGYEVLAEETYKLKVRNKYIIHLSKNDYKVEDCKDSRAKIIFISALNLTKFRKEYNL